MKGHTGKKKELQDDAPAGAEENDAAEKDAPDDGTDADETNKDTKEK